MGWRKYVPVRERLAKAKNMMSRLKKKGRVIEPIEIAGKIIAKKFWGKKWCDHLETFSDYRNRLPRGRTYVRNGSVCHLGIEKGSVNAVVSGSYLYDVEVKVSFLEQSKWKSIKDKCSGQIGSLLELLKGKVSDHVMEVVADHEEGLFPNESEIHFSCTCPDWADMCKHVAAVLYGIGNRLDENPDLLFILRGVDPSELIKAELSTTTNETEDILEDEGLADIFGIDLDESAEKDISSAPLTGEMIQKIRKEKNLSVQKFAEALEVTSASIYRWEKTKGIANIRERTVSKIRELFS